MQQNITDDLKIDQYPLQALNSRIDNTSDDSHEGCSTKLISKFDFKTEISGALDHFILSKGNCVRDWRCNVTITDCY